MWNREFFWLMFAMTIQSPKMVSGLRCYECTTDPQSKSKLSGFSDFIVTTPDCHEHWQKMTPVLCPFGTYFCQVAVAQSGEVSATFRSCVTRPLYRDGRHDIGNGVILHYKSCQTDCCNAAVTSAGVSLAALFCLAVYTIAY